MFMLDFLKEKTEGRKKERSQPRRRSWSRKVPAAIRKRQVELKRKEKGGRSRPSRRGDHSRYKRYSHFIVAQIASTPRAKAKSLLKSSSLPDRHVVVIGPQRAHATRRYESFALCAGRLFDLDHFAPQQTLGPTFLHPGADFQRGT